MTETCYPLCRLFAGVFLRMLYGIDIFEVERDEAAEEVVHVIETVTEAFQASSVPGSFLVEFFPSLQYVPAWVPGAGFQSQLAIWREAAAKMVELPYERVKAAIVNLV